MIKERECMNQQGWMMFRVFMNRYNPKDSHSLLKFLPSEEMQAVMRQNIHSADLCPILQPPQKSLANIHYSWFKPILEKFPKSLQPVMISSLTPEQMLGLKMSSSLPVSSPVKKFMLHQIYHLLKLDEHMPIEYLPETELSFLTKWSKKGILNLIDFLGLHDLASEVRYIVSRNYLKNIYTCLNPKQLHYLKICLHQKEQIISPKLGINASQQDCVKLKQVVHRRGLVRLGKSLCGEHPDLVWHIAHILDTGRGNLLLKEYKPEALSKITAILQQQVLNLTNFLKSE